MKRFLAVTTIFVLSLVAIPVSAISDEQKSAVIDHCSSIKDNLKKVQKNDARTRVHLGGRYETILSKFVIPLNVRLVENNLSNPKLVENQNNLTDAKSVFSDDYINYQQSLEELVGIDCKNEPEKFYDKLVRVRKKRQIMEQDVLKIRTLISEHVQMVTEIKGKI